MTAIKVPAISKITRAVTKKTIGVSGYARSGKDTVGQFLVSQGFVRVAFADTIRDILYRLNPMLGQRRLAEVVDELGWDFAKTQWSEVRRLLQVMGTEAGRDVLGPDVWVATALSNLPAADVVITDVRYPNEVEAIRALGGEIWRVVRPGTEPVNDHISDSALNDFSFDHIIDNSGTVEDLHNIVRGLL